MTSRADLRTDGAAETLRRGVYALAGLGIAGTTIELAILRHWQGVTQLIVWPAIVALGIGLTVLLRRPSARRVRAVRTFAVVVAAVALVGMVLHVTENVTAGPLDRDFAARWDSMSAVEQWWEAITGGVGPAPALAPAVLAEISLALFVGTVRHPALSPTPHRAT